VFGSGVRGRWPPCSYRTNQLASQLVSRRAAALSFVRLRGDGGFAGAGRCGGLPSPAWPRGGCVRHKSSSCVLVLCVGGKCGEQGRHLADWNPEFIFQLQAVGERNGLCVDVLVWPSGSCGDLFDGKGWRWTGVQSVTGRFFVA